MKVLHFLKRHFTGRSEICLKNTSLITAYKNLRKTDDDGLITSKLADGAMLSTFVYV